jgi:sortase A
MRKNPIKTISKARRWIERLLFLAGILALGTWAWSVASNAVYQDWESWVFDHQIRGQRAIISDYLAETRDRIAADIRGWLGFEPIPQPHIPRTYIRPPARRPALPDKNGLLGRLNIPRLHLTAMVREGDDDNVLRLALGHIPGTAMPGQNGNVGVAGHRDTLFRGLRRIDKNDLILFETTAGNYSYKVETTEIVSPKNVSVLKAGVYPELTLVTCYPFHYIGSAPERFIVKAREVARSAAGSELAKTQQEDNPVAALQALAGDGAAAPAAAIDSGANHIELRRRAVEHARGMTKVSFEVSRSHSRQLSPGISFGLAGIEMDRFVNGWIWLAPDRRTIWLRGQRARESVVFYDRHDGKRHELVITSIARNSVKGYLLVSVNRTNAMLSSTMANNISAR